MISSRISSLFVCALLLNLTCSVLRADEINDIFGDDSCIEVSENNDVPRAPRLSMDDEDDLFANDFAEQKTDDNSDDFFDLFAGQEKNENNDPSDEPFEDESSADEGHLQQQTLSLSPSSATNDQQDEQTPNSQSTNEDPSQQQTPPSSATDDNKDEPKPNKPNSQSAVAKKLSELLSALTNNEYTQMLASALVRDLLKSAVLQAKLIGELAVTGFMGYKALTHIKKLATDTKRPYRHALRAGLYTGGSVLAFHALMTFVRDYEANLKKCA